MKRVVIQELLDTDAGTPREVAGSLADLRMLNRRFGGISAMAAMIGQVATARGLSSVDWLDVAGGFGDVASMTSAALLRRGIQTRPVLLDRAETHLPRRYPAVCADALDLPFRDNSFDVVGCCLFLHHLEPQQVTRFVQESLRVARHAVLINDLVRNPLHLAFAYAGAPIYRSRLTRHDAPASVRRAYTPDELRSMLAPAGAIHVNIDRYFFFRMGVIAWKRPSTT
jgi:ubiquinone/menaquinone biosynthesis C-methylase UbiE